MNASSIVSLYMETVGKKEFWLMRLQYSMWSEQGLQTMSKYSMSVPELEHNVTLEKADTCKKECE